MIPAGLLASGIKITDVPKLFPNLNLWLSADRIQNVANGASIASWDDLSNGGNHASQSIAGNRPTYSSNSINGLPAIYFDGADMLQCSTLPSTTPERTILLVWWLSSGSGGWSKPLTSAGGGLGITMNPGPALSLDKVGETAMTVANAALNTWYLSTFTYSDSLNLARIRLNGVQQAQNTTSATLGGPSTSYIGAKPDFTEGVLGKIAEIISYSAVRTSEEVLTLETYLARKYGFVI